MILAKFLKKNRYSNARPAYEAIVAAARHPVFYSDYGVPDTVAGRFEMITLHAFLVMNRLNREGESGQTAVQALVDEVFRDMDRSLREMGVGDLSVGKRVRKMAEVFYGRAEAYKAALGQQSPAREEALRAVLQRNVFSEQASGAPDKIVLYIKDVENHLLGLDARMIADGKFHFPEPVP